MNATVAVFTRELKERSRIFLIAAALAVIPFIAASVPAARGQRTTAIAAVGGYLSIIYALAIAVGLGTSVIGRELGQKKLSYYFSKPITPTALWSGKAVAALVTIFVAFAIIGVPAYLASTREAWWSAWKNEGRPLMVWVTIACVVLFLLSHAIGTVIRSRSALIALDFLALMAVVFIAFLLLRPLAFGGAMKAATNIAKIAGGTLLATLAIAPVWQLARGRTDARRGHAALSMFIWSVAGILVVVFSAYVLWIVSAPLSSITQFGLVQQSPSGEWVLISGESSRGEYYLASLVNTRTGEQVKTKLGPWWREAVSRDGSMLATTSLYGLDPHEPSIELRVEQFGKHTHDAVQIPVKGFAGYELSPDGSRVAVADGGTLSVYDSANGRLVMAVRAPDLTWMYFVSPALLRIMRSSDIYELDVPRRTMTRTGSLSTKDYLSVSGDGSRVYLRKEARLYDARTGALIAELPKPDSMLAGAIMDDGRVAIIAKSVLHLFDRDGRELKTIALPNLTRAGIRVQMGNDKLFIGTNDGTVIVDLARGVAGPVVDIRGPVGGWNLLRLPRLNDDALILSATKDKKIVMWNPRTGERKPLAL